jgi:hypothetical protein
MHPTCPFVQQTSQGAQAAAHGTQTRWERTVGGEYRFSPWNPYSDPGFLGRSACYRLIRPCSRIDAMFASMIESIAEFTS